MASSIADQIGEDDPTSVIATTLVAYCFSSILTGEHFIFSVPTFALLLSLKFRCANLFFGGD